MCPKLHNIDNILKQQLQLKQPCWCLHLSLYQFVPIRRPISLVALTLSNLGPWHQLQLEKMNTISNILLSYKMGGGFWELSLNTFLPGWGDLSLSWHSSLHCFVFFDSVRCSRHNLIQCHSDWNRRVNAYFQQLTSQVRKMTLRFLHIVKQQIYWRKINQHIFKILTSKYTLPSIWLKGLGS